MKICYSCFSELPPGAKVCPRCGADADLKNEDKYPHALPCGTVLNGRYVVGRVLGQGGFGITYAGQDLNSKKLVAIKEYFPDTMAVRGMSSTSHTVTPLNADRSEGFEYGKEQFLREARTLSAFIGSPNIVRVYSFFEENGTAYFVMEYVRGENLKQYVEGRGGRISWEEAWKLLMPVLEALSEVHSRQIIHRDIKPENIIITKGGRAKLIDFGAARYNYVEKSSSLTAILTPGYAPPEQYYRKGEQGPWTDIYALAATMYFCITGMPPSEAIERTYGDRLEKPSSLGISIPDYEETALLKALALKKEERFQTTYDFRNEVLSKMEPPEDEDGAPPPAPEDPDKVIFTETRKKAASGDPEAQYMLGYLYEMGKGICKDEEEAVIWYSKAAKQGNTAGKRSLDRLRGEKNDGGETAGDKGKASSPLLDNNETGGGETTKPGKYPEEALLIFLLTVVLVVIAAAGIKATSGAGQMAEEPEHIGLNEDSSTADEKKAEEASAQSKTDSGVTGKMEEESEHTGHNKDSSTVDETIEEQMKIEEMFDNKKAELIKGDAEIGDADAQYEIAENYYYGKGVEQDYKEAVKWYAQATKQGHAAAQNNLGYMYQNGYGVEQDYARAVEWYAKSA